MHFGRYTSGYGASGDVFRHHRIRANLDMVTNLDRAKKFRTASYVHMTAQYHFTGECHLLKKQAIGTDYAIWMYDYARWMRQQ